MSSTNIGNSTDVYPRYTDEPKRYFGHQPAKHGYATHLLPSNDRNFDPNPRPPQTTKNVKNYSIYPPTDDRSLSNSSLSLNSSWAYVTPATTQGIAKNGHFLNQRTSSANHSSSNDHSLSSSTRDSFRRAMGLEPFSASKVGDGKNSSASFNSGNSDSMADSAYYSGARGGKQSIYDSGSSSRMSEDVVKKKEEDRAQWGSQIEFLLACIGYAVGVGNVWRFPFLCYKNGGGAFLIPYTISLFLAGLPIFYLELVLGQFSSLGPNCVFGKIAPALQGIGWAMVVVSTFVSIYYNMIIAWVLFYFGASFRSVLQWSSCMLGDWYTEKCFSKRDQENCISTLNDSAAIFYNRSCMTGTVYAALDNVTRSSMMSELRSPGEEYWERYVLNISDGIENMGGLQWKLVVSLGAAWVIVFLCLIKGVQSTGKVVYFTATFPYLVLVILLIRGCTLPGAGLGIKFYMTANYTRLADVNVWKDAAIQIFYSLGPAWGGLITMSSYNKFSNNCFRDALIVTFTNCGTSVFAGFAIFSVTGFMAQELGRNVSEVVRDGTGLAFIAYPEAITRMPLSPLWSILFFFMLITLGLDSQFATLETVTTALMDQFTSLRRYKTWVVLTACIVMFIIGLPLCTRGGMYVFTLLNDYSAGYCLIVIALAELVTVVHLYGFNHFKKDIEMMLGQYNSPIGRVLGPVGYYFQSAWMVLCPIFLFGILIASFIFYKVSKYASYEFGPVAEGFGWLMSVMSWGMIPIFAVYHFIRNRMQGRPLSELWRVTDEWCPAHIREAREANRSAAPGGGVGPSAAGGFDMKPVNHLNQPNYYTANNNSNNNNPHHPYAPSAPSANVVYPSGAPGDRDPPPDYPRA